ncbi:DEAD/DEAH box helicase [Bacillaceae bacterium Marseille-Q3522]|nr:DEAD/DEAH box helicase [Bacillaceae bacterium Marseille-Q3522]
MINETKFSQFRFKPYIIEAVKELGFYEPTEIQKRFIPVVLKGESAVGQSQTGSGKTHAYLLPILQKIDSAEKIVQAVIIAPTRELARQIYQEILKITAHASEEEAVAVRLYIGGTDKQRAIEKLKQQPQIVVGTPSRIYSLITEQALFVHTAKILVADEADLMLDMGFIAEVDQVAARMPEQLQMLVFSATIPEKLKPFLKKYLANPTYIRIGEKQAAAENIEHLLLPARHKNKAALVCDILHAFNPYLAIVFTNTKKQADELADFLLEKGLKAGRLHGDLSPRERKKIMKQILDLDFQYIVATDLAARGIDIQGVSHVINYELPKDTDFYIHRVGRTARAGTSGTALTIYEPEDENALAQLESRGIVFQHVELKNGEWVELADRNKRKKRLKKTGEMDKQVNKIVKKPKKIKPGYKKKLQLQAEKLKKRKNRLQRKK